MMHRLYSCFVHPDAGLCTAGKHVGSYLADKEMRSAETGSASWRRAAHFHTAWSPENRSLARPSSRYSLAWYSHYRPPAVAAFSPTAVLGDPLLAITPLCPSAPAPLLLPPP